MTKYKEQPNHQFKTWLRRCHRCDKVYRSIARHGMICPDCNKQYKRKLYTFDENDWLVEKNKEEIKCQ